MIYILLVFAVTSYRSVAISTTEMSSKATCEVAGAKLAQTGNFTAYCFKK